MSSGVLEKWFEDKGFGFIKRDGFSGRGIFVHISDLPEGTEPRVGMVVEFEIEQTEKGPHAISVKLLDDVAKPVQFGDVPPEAA